MSSSRHPIALRLEQQVGGATKLLATVMLLPLIDGIFPALVLADALSSTVGILQVGLLVFGGSATVAVVLVEMEADPVQQSKEVLMVGIPLILIAGLEAAMAPTIASVIDVVIFERFAAIVIVAIAAKTASSTIGEYLPRASVIIGLGAIASLNPGAFSVAVTTDLELVARAMAAGGTGVGFALLLVLLRPRIEHMVDIDRFRFGSAVALGTLALSIIGLVPTEAPLPVFAMAALLAIDPTDESEESATETLTPRTPTSTDGGSDGVTTTDEETKDQYGYPGEGEEDRAPWV
ncbi:DUF5794 domain-containing protein [Halodesulfurarchaeum sp. HSR-GB]|uniref:DUF5794 domain-containing protein n=1 Tax=Halodesulfurarchaeum sp. HSR-GB TaxID=3074077 RepID=UPI0028569B0F|nr:DUF5794 domain-containing protein [Halodesulfurarchaeum sp. HSR-GB]MDR5657315.1 DUF5794 domain-containing protein [Halodesulfurarchaeum sp. HSR-GB]